MEGGSDLESADPDRPLSCVRAATCFVLHWSVAFGFTCQPGAVPRDAVHEKMSVFVGHEYQIVSVVQSRVRTMLFMALPVFDGPTPPVVWALVQLGGMLLTDSAIVPFASTPSWPGLWGYLLRAREVRAVPGVRYQLEVQGFVFSESMSLEFLPPNCVARLSPVLSSDPLLHVPTPHAQLRWPSSLIGLQGQVGHIPLQTVASPSLCLTCFRAWEACELQPGVYESLARRGHLGLVSATHCAVVRHAFRHSYQGRTHIHSFPRCLHPRIIQLFLASTYAVGSEPLELELLPRGVSGFPTWQPGVCWGFCAMQYLPGDVQAGAQQDGGFAPVSSAAAQSLPLDAFAVSPEPRVAGAGARKRAAESRCAALARKAPRVAAILSEPTRAGLALPRLIAPSEQVFPASPSAFVRGWDVDVLCLLHPHPQDWDIKFNPEGRRYTLCGRPTDGSVTGVIHFFSQPFVADAVIDGMRASANWPRTGYLRDDLRAVDLVRLFAHSQELVGRLLQSPRDEPRICRDLQRLLATAPHLAHAVETLCLSRQEIAAKWRDGAAEASHAGTWMHFLFEAHVNGHAVRLPAMELAMLRTFLSELPPGSAALRSEWAVSYTHLRAHET